MMAHLDAVRDIAWTCRPFDELSPAELYDLMQLRQRVFVVEQNCAYLDADGSDPAALHLLGRVDASGGARLAAYARLFPPGVKYAEASIGRVATHPELRRTGLGHALMRECIVRISENIWGPAIRLQAQMYLEAFYEGYGFHRVSESYTEDGILHVDMLREHPLSDRDLAPGARVR